MDLPIQVANGSPGYINLLDALNAWQLVNELSKATGLAAAACFKHVSPAGVAVSVPLSKCEAQACMVTDTANLPPIAIAYIRARSSPLIPYYADYIALSHRCDLQTAKLISRNASYGVIAPSYEKRALDMLSTKKGGDYVVLKIDPHVTPEQLEEKSLSGLRLRRKIESIVTDKMFTNIVTKTKELPEAALRDLIIATIATKYIHTTSVVLAHNGQLQLSTKLQTIGIGQGSPIQSTRSAAEMAELWFFRQHPKVLKLEFSASVKRLDRCKIIDEFVNNPIEIAKYKLKGNNPFTEEPEKLTEGDKLDWKNNKMSNICMSSDVAFPLRDCIDRAHQSAVCYVASPSGSACDQFIIDACDENNMTLVHIQQANQ